MILRKETETSATNSHLNPSSLTIIRMNDTPQGDGNLHITTPYTFKSKLSYKNE